MSKALQKHDDLLFNSLKEIPMKLTRHHIKLTFKRLLLALFFINVTPSMAQDGFIGEIRMFAGNFAPRGWAFCNGQLLPISQNAALFSILGTTYGGDGRTTFALPDLRGRAPIHAGNGPGLTDRRLGSKGGQETVTLTVTQMPSHSHTIAAPANTSQHVLLSTDKAVRVKPQAGDVPAAMNFGSGFSATPVKGYGPATNTVQGQTITPQLSASNTGGGQAHDNMPPYATVNYIIALVGIFPSRN